MHGILEALLVGQSEVRTVGFVAVLFEDIVIFSCGLGRAKEWWKVNALLSKSLSE